jgi:hypothetical protein
MAQYEIRIVKATGAKSLIYACECLSDQAVLHSAQQITREAGDRIEIWQGMRCVHADPRFAKTG